MCFAPQQRQFFDITTSKSGPCMWCFVHFDLDMCFAPQQRQFFDITTSKSGPCIWCFVHFDLDMCFAPQQRALLQHLNAKKFSGTVGFLHFLLGNVLRAATACTFSTSQLPKVLQHWCVLHILTWKCASRRNSMHFFNISTSKSGLRIGGFMCFLHFDLKCASRHNGVQFFIPHMASWLRTRRFSEPTFPSPQSHKSWEKHSESRLSYLFAHVRLLSYSFSSLIFSLLSFSLTLPTSAFPSVHIVGSLTSKLPSPRFAGIKAGCLANSLEGVMLDDRR